MLPALAARLRQWRRAALYPFPSYGRRFGRIGAMQVYPLAMWLQSMHMRWELGGVGTFIFFSHSLFCVAVVGN